MGRVITADGDIRKPVYTTLYDQIDDTTAYVGKASPGTALATAAWQVRKLTYSGSSVDMQWADSDQQYDNVWDNRASLSYGY